MTAGCGLVRAAGPEARGGRPVHHRDASWPEAAGKS
jgi:hypothetical protein